MKKTNAMRILDGLKIKYEILTYEDDGEHELEHGIAAKTAEKIGVAPEQLFKTIVMQTESKEIAVFCQSATHQVGSKKARNACGSKIRAVKSEDLLELTGYVRGGCTPIGMKKNFPVFIDKSALDHEYICVSAGARGKQIKLSPQDLIKACGAQVVDLTQE